jgi:hypothetical protein
MAFDPGPFLGGSDRFLADVLAYIGYMIKCLTPSRKGHKVSKFWLLKNKSLQLS